MKPILVILLCAVSSQMALSQVDLPPDSTTWLSARMGMFGYDGRFEGLLYGDSTINDIAYKKYYENDDLRGFVRADSSVWYVIAEGEGEEHVLYDFNIAVGDTFHVDSPLLEYGGQGEWVVCDSITTRTFEDGTTRDKYNLRGWSDESGGPFETVWYEGIGSLKLLSEVTGCIYFDCGSYRALCYQEDGVSVYTDQNGLLLQNYSTGVTYIYEDCTLEFYVGITDNSIGTLEVYPNPAQQQVNIDVSMTIVRLMLYNSMGRKVLEEELYAEEHTLDLSTVPKGLYTLGIQLANDQFVCKQLLVVD